MVLIWFWQCLTGGEGLLGRSIACFSWEPGSTTAPSAPAAPSTATASAVERGPDAAERLHLHAEDTLIEGAGLLDVADREHEVIESIETKVLHAGDSILAASDRHHAPRTGERRARRIGGRGHDRLPDHRCR